MIKKIKKIKDFGVFKKFDGSALPDFKTFNLIYGWNYSGKTTLSRVFRCLEIGKIHDDYLTATFEIENATAKYDNTFVVNPNIRVFNSDFVKENLKWDTDNIEPIFLLGAENIELQTELKKKENDLAIAETQLAEANRSRTDKQNKLNTALTNKAREITNLLSLGRTFDRDKLKQLVETVKEDATNYILSQSDFDKYKAQAISNEQKPSIGEVTISIAELATLKSEVETILHRQPISTNKIQKLLDNKPISDWVETGKTLHIGKTYCEFCGNTLPTDLLASLNEHFSKDYDQLKTDIEAKLNTLLASKINLDTQLPTETAFYIDILPDFRVKKPLLESEITNFNNSIDSLIKDLENKKDKPFDRLNVTAFSDNKTTLEVALTNFNQVIKTNDQRSAGFINDKNAAIERLKEHFVADFETTETYSVIQIQLTNEQTSIDAKGLKILEQKQAIALIKAQLDATVKGAGAINDYLKIFFGKDDIQITPTTDKRFQLLRGNDIAKNLSEGEKTAIAFAYFTAKLEEQNNKIADTIIYIDDPISSLDSNHLYNIFSFIKVKYKEAKQLFLSTHNYEFLNLIKSWLTNKYWDEKDKTEFFEVKRISQYESSLQKMNEKVKKFNSEYVYLFSLLYEAHLKDNQAISDYELSTLPNIIRRFLECYLWSRKPDGKSWTTKIALIITDQILAEKIIKLLHQNSHSWNIEEMLKIPNVTEVKEVIDAILLWLDTHDNIHYSVLI